VNRLLATSCLLAVLAVTGTFQANAGTPGCAHVQGRGWTSVPLPPFPNRLDKPKPVYTAPHASAFTALGRQVWVTDGNAVMTSSDGGCRWSTVYRLPADSTELTINGSSEINELGVVGSQPLAMVEGWSSGAVPTLTVLRLGAAGAQRASGLPAFARPVYDESGVHRRLFTSPHDPSSIYLISCAPVSVSLCDQPTVYGSSDAGRTFTVRGALPHAGSGYTGVLAIDPTNSKHLWASDAVPSRLRTSVDGGRTWTTVEGVLHGLYDLQAIEDEGRVRLIGRDSQGSSVRASDDSGRTWRVDHPAAPLEYLDATGPLVMALAVPADGPPKVVSWQTRTGRFTDLTPAPRPALEELHASGAGTWARSSDRLWMRVSTQLLRGGQGAASRSVTTEGSSRAQRAWWALSRQTVTIPTGATRQVPMSLHLPRTHAAAEVGLLLDATGSMEAADHGLADAFHEVTQGLAPTARFAVATFGEYALRQYAYDAPEFNIPYERLTDLVPAGPRLDDALRRISNDGGSNDTLTSALPALQQALTGSGQHLDDPGRVDNSDIPAGQQMSFRGNGLRVVVLATDSEAHQPPGYPGPALADVVTELRRRRVLLVGLDVAGGAVRGTSFLTALARGSGALAPAEGVDCDGDGRVDLTADAPLVCPVGAVLAAPAQTGTGLATAITALLDSLPQPQQLQLRAHTDRVTVRLPGVRVIDTHLQSLDLPLRSAVTCPRDPTRQDVELSALLGSSVAATASLQVRCADVPASLAIAGPLPPAVGALAPPLVAGLPPGIALQPPPPAIPGQALVPQPGAAPAAHLAGAPNPRKADAPAFAYSAAHHTEEHTAALMLLKATAVTGAAVALARQPRSPAPARHEAR
jgi:hypothetical protein